MPKQIIQILLWMDLLFLLADWDSFKSETRLKLQKQSVPQKSPLGSLPLSTFWPDFCYLFYIFFYFRFYMKLISTFICFQYCFWFWNTTITPDFFFSQLYFNILRRAVSGIKPNSPLGSSTAHGLSPTKMMTGHGKGGMKQPLPCPNLRHVLKAISPQNIIEKPFSFKSVEWRHLWMLLKIMMFQKDCQGLQHLMVLLTGNMWVRGNTHASCWQEENAQCLHSEESIHVKEQ